MTIQGGGCHMKARKILSCLFFLARPTLACDIADQEANDIPRGQLFMESTLTLAPGCPYVDEKGYFALDNKAVGDCQSLCIQDPQGIVTTIGNSFLRFNAKIRHITFVGFENLTIIEDYFLTNMSCIQSVILPSFPNLEYIGSCCISHSPLKHLSLPDLPSLSHIGGFFLSCNMGLSSLSFGTCPKMVDPKQIDPCFLSLSSSIRQIHLPCPQNPWARVLSHRLLTALPNLPGDVIEELRTRHETPCTMIKKTT